jgi:Ca-activated chloride channel family protein
MPAPLLATEVEMRVTGVVLRGMVRQQFANPSGDWAEGVYVFPLPEDAAVDHLRMQVGDRIVEGVIQERAAARAAYAQARQEGKRGGLVEQERPNVFTTSVANAVIGSAGDGTAALVLVACYPFDAVNPGGPLRYVVAAEAASAEARRIGSE